MGVKRIKKSVNVVNITTRLVKTHKDMSTLGRKLKNNAQVTKQYVLHPKAPFALVFNVAPWKRSYIRSYLPEYKLIFVSLNESLDKYKSLVDLANVILIVWGRSVLAHIIDFSQFHDLPIYHLEDGFIRSIGLGANHVPPMSICFDKHGLYFDSSKPSDLEVLLNTYDFEGDNELMQEAQKLMNEVIANNISKYNLPDTRISDNVYGPKVKERILVIGQVEDDQSLIYGCKNIPTNLDLLKLAVKENPDAQIIYKKHPDILYGKRKELSDITELSDYIEVINVNMSLKDALNQVDRVYTMTSLAGFEALLYGIPVTTMGAPFYSGWGLTDDRYIISRRKRKLSLLEVFAAAYILYPRYRSADALSASNLQQTINYIVENKEYIQFDKADRKFDYLSFYNMHTKMRVDNKFITNLSFDNIAIISDSIDSLNIAESVSKLSKMKVTLLTTRDKLANDELMVNTSKIIEEENKVDITSIHKRYSVPLSHMEQETVKITSVIAKSLETKLNDLFSGFLSHETIHYLSLGLRDYCYLEILRFLSIREVLEDYDAVLVYLEDSELNVDIIEALKHYGKAKNVGNKIFFALENVKIKDIFRSTNGLLTTSVKSNIAEVKTLAARFWYDISDKEFHAVNNLENIALICGNVQSDNYAYSPATKKIIETVSASHSGDSLFISSTLTNEKLINDFRKDFLEASFDSKTNVYNLTKQNYISKYGEVYTQHNDLFNTILPELVLTNSNVSMPSELLSLLTQKIKDYCGSLQAMMALITDVQRLVDNVSVFYTSMERATVSKVITSICKENNIKTIGIQPQIISRSRRYYAPAVDKIGVIDEGQKNILKEFGYEESRIHNVGSVNIIDRLNLMQDYSDEKESFDIFFAMQHSTKELMMPVIEALKDLAERYQLKIVIKPHPHQEIPIYYKVRSDLANINNIKVLSRESDTYLWLARSKIVVGMFSSVLLEAACYGKDVVVAAFGDLDDSINMSKQGIALNVDNQQELESTILDLLNRGYKWKILQQSRNAYLNRNPQFKQPYSTEILESFIKTNLPKIKKQEVYA